MSASCHAKIQDMRTFELTAKHDYALQGHAFSDMSTFLDRVASILMDLYQLFSLAPLSDGALIANIKEKIKQLESYPYKQGTYRDALST
jgi:hypothetical protein